MAFVKRKIKKECKVLRRLQKKSCKVFRGQENTIGDYKNADNY